MWPNPQFPPDLVTFTEEILNGKLHFLCSDASEINEIHFCFDPLIYFLYLYKIFTCADISFWMISFRDRVYMIFYHPKWNPFLSKWTQWNNNYNEFHSGVFRVNSNMRLTRHQNELFYFVRNEISCKYLFNL